MADVKALAESLVALTVKEVQELADVLKNDYGIEPAAAAVVVAGGGDGGGAAAAEEKTAFNVILKNGGASKLNVVKIVKDLTGLGLKEAKDMVDGAPKTVKENVSKAEAEEIAAKLKEAGADVETHQPLNLNQPRTPVQTEQTQRNLLQTYQTQNTYDDDTTPTRKKIIRHPNHQ